MTAITQDLHNHWTAISPLLAVRNEQEYDLAVERLNGLLDEIGTNEQHPLYTLLDTLGTVCSTPMRKNTILCQIVVARPCLASLWMSTA